MAAKSQFQPLHFQIQIQFLVLLIMFSTFLSSSQSTPQNIQVYFSTPTPPPPPLPLPPTTASPDTTATATSKSFNKPIVKAITITASCTLVLSGLLFLLLFRLKHSSKKETTNLYADDNRINYGNDNLGLHKNDNFLSLGSIKRVIVDDEQGKLHDHSGRKSKFDFTVQEIYFIRQISSGSRVWPSSPHHISDASQLVDLQNVENQETLKTQALLQSPPPPPPPLPPPNVEVPPRTPPVIGKKGNAPMPPLPPKSGGLTFSSQRRPPPPKNQVLVESSPPPPPPPPPSPNVTVPPPTPPVVGKKSNAPLPPLPPKSGGLTSSSFSSAYINKVKLKPLHWDKVNANVGHDMVWHQLHNGSFRVDDDQIKSLFGTVAINNQSPPPPQSTTSPKKEAQMKLVPSKIFLLDTKKSQNIAIILKSITISTPKLISSLQQGLDLDIDTLEKLTRIAPSKQEATTILEFEGDITKLADAESFLYQILKSVPSAFTRITIMLFKLNYSSQVSDFKNSLQTLETACEELKVRGLFVKLLEAVLKAGNRMNAGTSRGNAHAFNLTSLLKLSDVKSSDGTTTLLHFVVEEVVKLEGKRCNYTSSAKLTLTDNYYVKLGLPVVGGVSSEFCNVKKAAGIEYDVFSKLWLGLRNDVEEIKKSMEECEGDGFVREMGRFIEGVEMEIGKLREEEERVMGVVKRTNEYYQGGGLKEFELFVIIRGFLEMVDKACVDIAVKLQKRRSRGGLPEVGMGAPVKFPALPANFRIT